jgi:putative endonuclease
MNNKPQGASGEDTAALFIKKKGFEILERNYRYQHGEVDIIGMIDNVLLVFFEVKFRKNSDFGNPEVFVSRDQQKSIIRVAEHYIEAINWHKDIRFDILAITGKEVYHIEDAFY